MNSNPLSPAERGFIQTASSLLQRGYCTSQVPDLEVAVRYGVAEVKPAGGSVFDTGWDNGWLQWSTNQGIIRNRHCRSAKGRRLSGILFLAPEAIEKFADHLWEIWEYNLRNKIARGATIARGRHVTPATKEEFIEVLRGECK